MQVNGSRSSIGTNVPAIVRGWEKEGRAKVELLAPAEGLPMGSEITVGIRTEAKGRVPHDFTLLNKQGLRVGGIVLLRRLRQDSDAMTARAAEILIMRESDGAGFVIQDAASCILPPPPGTAMVNEGLVAMLSSAVVARTLTEGVAKVLPALDQPIVFGLPGLAFIGTARNGDHIEVIVGGDIQLEAKDLIARMLRECPKDIIKESRTSSSTTRQPWHLVPFFRAPIDPDRSSKMSAQAANLSYGTADAPKWTTGHVVLRAIANRWHICDASPADEPSGPAASLVDLPL